MASSDRSPPPGRPPRGKRGRRGEPSAPPLIPKASPLRRAWQWLLEDPSKKAPKGPTERDQAVAAAEARRAADREHLARARLGAAAPLLLGKDPTRPKTRAATSRPGRWKRAVHAALGETTTPRSDGGILVIPPPRTDWRWALHRFFRSNVRAVAYVRTFVVVAVVLLAAWSSLFAATGFDATALARSTDPDDPRTEYKLPFFIVESGSMMHTRAPYGRVGTIDPGDIVVLEKVHDRRDLETFYGSGRRESAGAHGDVIMFLTTEREGGPPARPIIHRAMAYLEKVDVVQPNPRPGPGQPPTVQVSRFNVEELGILNAPSVTIPDLGLFNYQPEFGGFLTRGDNVRTNNWADQALGITPDPIPFERIIGRYKAEVPVLGLAKIALTGQAPGSVTVGDGWCSFLAGKAACDTWRVFFFVVIVLVTVPLGATLLVFGRRAYLRHLDAVALRRFQAEEERRAAAGRRPGGPSGGPTGLPVHDATDLLSGRIHVPGAPQAGPADRSVPVARVALGGV